MTIKLKIDGHEMQISQEEALLFIRIGEQLKQNPSFKKQALCGAATGAQTMTDSARGPRQNFSGQPATPSAMEYVLADC